MRRSRTIALLTASALVLASCGGGDGGGEPVTPAPTPVTPVTPVTPAGLYAVPAAEALTPADVSRIVAQAVGEAQARALPSYITVVDRVGNVLAVYRMNGARETASIPRPPRGGAAFDVQGLDVPASVASISKAITAAYLSSSGNAFTSRTASDIVQEHFPLAPNTVGLESGPLFGVQFSSLPCSDLNRRFGPDGTTGPKRAPLGLSADAGSIPLYKNGVVVGGIGVMGDGSYGSDSDTADVDDDAEEYVAVAGAQGYEAAAAIRADRVSIDGTLLSYSDADASRLRSNPATPPSLSGPGGYVAVPAYYDGAGPLAGTPYATAASGYRPATAAERAAGTAIDNPDAVLVVDQAGDNRFPIRAGTDGAEVMQPLTAAEVKAIAEEAFKVMTRARGAIRQPLDSRMQATISIVDSRGQVLAIQRSPDAPVFGTDVSLQKARSAAFLSSPRAAADLLASGSADVAGFVQKTRDFLGRPDALTGTIAFAERPIGLLARPYFPDGQVNTANGPLSRPIASFNPFSTGLQSALILGNLFQHLGALGGGPDTPARCTTLPPFDASGGNRLQNGLQIFPGGEPIYRGTVMVGAIGVSGDGIDQDDMVSFLGLVNGGRRVGTVGHAPREIRISAIPFAQANNGFLPYVQCPVAPFLDTPEQNVCEGN